MSFLQKFSDIFSKRASQSIDKLNSSIDALNTSGIIETHIAQMLKGVLEIREMRAYELMIPRANIDFFYAEEKLIDVIDRVLEYGHSRYPILSEESEESIGLLFSKDLLRIIYEGNYQHLTLKDLAKPIRIIPETKKVTNLLQEFQRTHTHLALVVNEMGDISGLITIEDILEEIVGEILDEFDIEEMNIRQVSKTSFDVLGSTSIEEFNEFFNCHLSDEEFDTISGYIINQLQRAPVKNESFYLGDNQLFVRAIQLNERQIIKLRIRSTDQTLASNFGYKELNSHSLEGQEHELDKDKVLHLTDESLGELETTQVDELAQLANQDSVSNLDNLDSSDAQQELAQQIEQLDDAHDKITLQQQVKGNHVQTTIKVVENLESDKSTNNQTTPKNSKED